MYIKLDDLKKGVGSLYEFSLTRSLNDTVLKLCQKGGWSRVRHIVLRVGELRKVDPELLTLAFNIVSRGTRTEGANLSILFLPAIFYCQDCKREATIEIDKDRDYENFEPICPVCGGHHVEIRSGTELSIEFIEVEKHLPWQLNDWDMGEADNNDN